MSDEYFGVVEMVFSFGLIIILGVWQLRSLEKARKRLRDEQSKADDKR
jgi:cytochrome oxidase assembly protein ShyY1